MVPPNSSGNGLPLPHPSLPGNPYNQQQQPQASSQQPQPEMMQYLHMQMAMQQQFMQSQAYAYGGHYNPQMMMRQSLFQPVSYQPTQNEQGYTYSSSYLEQQQHQQNQSANQALPIGGQSSNVPSQESTSKEQRNQKMNSTATQAKKPRLHAPAKPNVTNGGAWRNCVQEGCAFVGPDKDVDLHEQDRHLIYKKLQVARSEEEEAALKGGGPAPPIPGTSIRLETEEDIAKWIAQRRARWPTAARVEEKEKERQDKIARGEIDPNASTRGRRGRGGRATQGTRGRGRGRGGAEIPSGARTRDAGYQQRSQPVATSEKKEQGDSDGTTSNSESDSEEDNPAEGPNKAPDLPDENSSLLENPINQTLSNLSQAIQFLVDNDFLDGVELQEGDLAEAKDHGIVENQNLVQMVEETPDSPATGLGRTPEDISKSAPAIVESANADIEEVVNLQS
ncbi:hypothetical protein QFC19_005496 [Naganishia cerealis]|uniref:Uncharacterized protein n=1 Tax=Naganishia cerealis TaxID=610337 RepID=A0ACC2VQG4_9TREE|nr:hypothetical protein QFC19_005496 [Naganishia cerealis]